MFLIKHFVLSNIHLGHKTNKWNPRTASFLLGMRDGIHVIDLEQTILMAKRALNFVKKVCERRGYIFFVCRNDSSPMRTQYSGRNPSFIDNPRRKNPVSVSLSSSSLDGKSHLAHNLSSTLKTFGPTGTEPRTTQHSNESVFVHDGQLQLIHCGPQSGPHSLVQKRQGKQLFFQPEAVFILNTAPNAALIKEAIKLQIPIIAVLDSDSDPYGIQYPIPGNDDSVDAISLYTELLLAAVAASKQNELKKIVSR